MSKCTYTIKTENGDFELEIPSLALDANSDDFKTSLINYLITEGVKPSDLLIKIDETTKNLIVPESMKGFVLGQNSLKNVTYGIKNTSLKSQLKHIETTLSDYWKATPPAERGKNPSSRQNIVFAAFDESIEYHYDSDNDVVYINSINGIDYENVLKASLERAAYLVAGSNKESIINLDPTTLSVLNINNDTAITPDSILSLYFNDNAKKGNIDDYLETKKESYIRVKENNGELMTPENRDDNFEPVNSEFIYNLEQGDLIFKSHEKGYVDKTDKFGKSDGSYSMFVDYSINKEGKYVIRVISPNSDYAEKIVLDKGNDVILSRKLSKDFKFDGGDTKTSIQYNEDKYTTVNLSKDLYFNNKDLYKTLKRGDVVTYSGKDYIVDNIKGAILHTHEVSGGRAKKLKPKNKIKTIKLNNQNIAHYKTSLKKFDTNFTKVVKVNKELINNGDVITYKKKGDSEITRGVVMYGMSSILTVLNENTGESESVSENSIREHYIYSKKDKILLENLEANRKELTTTDPYNYGNWLDSNYNWMQYHEGLVLQRGDNIIIGDDAYVLIEGSNDLIRKESEGNITTSRSYNSLLRVSDGNNYITVTKDDLKDAKIATKRQQDPELSKISINKNLFYVSNDKNEYPNYNTTEVIVVQNKLSGEVRFVESITKPEEYNDITNQYKEENGFDKSDKLYTFDRKGVRVRKTETVTPVPDGGKNFSSIFDLIIPGTAIKPSMESKDLKYWIVEKKIGEDLLVSHSFHKKGEGVVTVKKLISSSFGASDVRLPRYATEIMKQMTDITGGKIKESGNIKHSKIIPRLSESKQLKEYDSPEVLLQMKELMENKFGININFVNSVELENFREVIPNIDSLRAFVTNGEYYINIDKSSIADPLHEYLHMVLASMKYSNPENYKLLVESVSTHPLFKSVSNSYQETDLDRLEETFVRLFSDTVRNKINQEGIFSEDIFDVAVKEGISEMFDLDSDLSEEYSYDLLNTEVRDVLTNFSSSLINETESLYNKDNAVEMISISTTLRNLIKNDKLKEQCNG